MTDQEFKAMEERVKKGETLPVLENFLFEIERQRREAGPNILQKKEKSHPNQVTNPPRRVTGAKA